MGFSSQEYWTGLLFPPPGDLPDSGIKPTSPALQADSLPSDPPGKPMNTGVGSLSFLQGSPDTPSELVWGNRNKEWPSAKMPGQVSHRLSFTLRARLLPGGQGNSELLQRSVAKGPVCLPVSRPLLCTRSGVLLLLWPWCPAASFSSHFLHSSSSACSSQLEHPFLKEANMDLSMEV